MIIKIKPHLTAMPGETVPEEDQCWAVYYGKPGDFKWLADFKRRAHAEFFAFMLAQNDGVSVER